MTVAGTQPEHRLKQKSGPLTAPADSFICLLVNFCSLGSLCNNGRRADHHLALLLKHPAVGLKTTTMIGVISTSQGLHTPSDAHTQR